MNNVPILSFYSGGGFMDIGFEQEGFKIKWANEFDKDFSILHSEGITNWRKSIGETENSGFINNKSILNITSNDILNEAFNGIKPSVFGIIGGPPCQDFSINGKRKGFDGERGKLTIHFFDRILELKPTFFVMENVTGLVLGKSIKEHFGKLLDGVRNDFFVDHKILNALNYGVPQSRERVFFIGINKKYITKENYLRMEGSNWFHWPVNLKYHNALHNFNWPKTNEFTFSIAQPEEIPYELFVESCLIGDSQMNLIPNADEFFPLKTNEEKLNKIKEGETNRPSFKRLHRFRYSPTTCYGNNEVHLHPYKNRRISVREALRIQGVPDSYILPENISKTKKFKMIGNGVPVPLAKAVAESLKSFLNSLEI